MPVVHERQRSAAAEEREELKAEIARLRGGIERGEAGSEVEPELHAGVHAEMILKNARGLRCMLRSRGGRTAQFGPRLGRGCQRGR